MDNIIGEKDLMKRCSNCGLNSLEPNFQKKTKIRVIVYIINVKFAGSKTLMKI